MTLKNGKQFGSQKKLSQWIALYSYSVSATTSITKFCEAVSLVSEINVWFSIFNYKLRKLQTLKCLWIATLLVTSGPSNNWHRTNSSPAERKGGNSKITHNALLNRNWQHLMYVWNRWKHNPCSCSETGHLPASQVLMPHGWRRKVAEEAGNRSSSAMKELYNCNAFKAGKELNILQTAWCYYPNVPHKDRHCQPKPLLLTSLYFFYGRSS